MEFLKDCCRALRYVSIVIIIPWSLVILLIVYVVPDWIKSSIIDFGKTVLNIR